MWFDIAEIICRGIKFVTFVSKLLNFLICTLAAQDSSHTKMSRSYAKSMT